MYKLNDRLKGNEVEVLLAKYLTLLQKRFQSRETIRAYASDLNQFFKGVEVLDRPVLLKKVLSLTHYSSASRARKIATLKGFLQWAYEEKAVSEDFSLIFGSTRVPRKLPRFLSVDEALLIWKTLQGQRDLPSKTDQLIFLLLYGSGLRVSEAANARGEKVSRAEMTIEVLGKGGKWRRVPLLREAISLIDELEGKIFILERENGLPLNVRTLHRRVQRMGVTCGLARPLHPHMLRHSYATHLLESGANLRSIQTLLGHVGLQTTEKYTHVTIDKLASTLEASHPLEKKK